MSVISPCGPTQAATAVPPIRDRSSAPPSPAPRSPWVTPEPGLTLWFTGRSGAGKTTLAAALARRLRRAGVPTIVLDADELHKGFCAGLGSSRADHTESVRRIAALAARLTGSGAVVLVAATAPYRDLRLAARKGIGRFLEVYVNAPLQTCVERDPKGVYSRAVDGEGPHVIAADPYEEPLFPDIECRTDLDAVDACTTSLLSHIRRYRAARSHAPSTPLAKQGGDSAPNQYVADGIAG